MVVVPSVPRRARRAAAIAVCGAVALAGCGSAQSLPVPKAVGAGSHASARDVLIRNVFILGPAPGQVLPRGGSAALFASFVNDATAPDRLVRVSAPGTAGSASIQGGGIDLPSRRLVPRGPAPHIMLEKLAKPLRGNETVRVALTFRDAGTVTMSAQVMTRTGPYATFAPSPSPTSGTPAASRTPKQG